MTKNNIFYGFYYWFINLFKPKQNILENKIENDNKKIKNKYNLVVESHCDNCDYSEKALNNIDYKFDCIFNQHDSAYYTAHSVAIDNFKNKRCRCGSYYTGYKWYYTEYKTVYIQRNL